MLLLASLFWTPIASSLRRIQLTERHRSVWQRAALKVRNDVTALSLFETLAVIERIARVYTLAGPAIAGLVQAHDRRCHGWLTAFAWLDLRCSDDDQA